MESKELRTAKMIAEEAAKKGWRALIVGGWVRDQVLGVESKDVDLEMFGRFEPNDLIKFLEQFGTVGAFGKRFGVLKLKVNGVDLDVSIPRHESKSGIGHTGFAIDSDPTMTVKEAAERRHFTIGAMSHDPLTGETIDPFGGEADLKAGILRHVGPSFMDDAFRVMVGFQMCGRFNLMAVPETVVICREAAREAWTFLPENLWEEWKKWAERSVVPSQGLRFLQQVGLLPVELEALVGLPQTARHHPEGSAFLHTLQAVDAAVEICDREEIVGENRLVCVLGALCHDLGKPTTTVWDGMRWTTFGHDVAGEKPTRSFLEGIGCPRRIIAKVERLVVTHMRGIRHKNNPVTKRMVGRLTRALEPASIKEWAVVVEADHSARKPAPGGMPERCAEIVRMAEEIGCEDSGPKEILMGRHLIEMGMEPGPEVGNILRRAFEAQMNGEFESIEEAIQWLKRSGTND